MTGLFIVTGIACLFLLYGVLVLPLWLSIVIAAPLSWGTVMLAVNLLGTRQGDK